VGQEHAFFTEAKARRLLELTERHVGPLKDIKALDVGCGVGLTDRYLGSLFSVVGVDISAGLIEAAAEVNPGVQYLEYDGKRLPFENESFDLAFAVCVVHHVPVTRWTAFMSEMARCVCASGLVVVFEHNPYNPLTRLAVHRCAFDEEVTLLPRSKAATLVRESGLKLVESAYILFFPWRLRAFSALEKHLGPIPLGSQYYVAAQKTSR
jgi:SAM-dependent methyltransferase